MALILIIDDSPTMQASIRKMVEAAGHSAVSAVDGNQGLQKAEEVHPDLILMDIVMPGLDGFKATRKLRKNALTADIPVLVVSSKDQEIDKAWAMQQGAQDYVVKPPSADELTMKIDQILAK